MNIFYWCVEYAACLLETILCVVFCGFFVDRDKLKKSKLKVFLLSVIMGMISILLNAVSLLSVLNSLLILFCFCIIIILFYRKLMAGLLTCVFYAIVGLIDVVIAGLSSVVTNINYNDLFGKLSYSRIICIIFSKILLILIIFFISKFFNKNNKLYKGYIVLISVYSVLLTITNFCTLILNITTKPNKAFLILVLFSIVSFITIILMFYFVLKLSDYYEKNKENSLIQLKNEMLQNSLDETQYVFNLWKQSIHDYKNQIILLEDLANRNDIEQIKYYLSKEKELVNSKVFYIKTGNSAVDAIINTKQRIAKKKKIEFTVNAKLTEICGIYNFDLSSILGNLIDNAIEASLSEEKPFIDLVIKVQKNFLIIKVVNKCTKALLSSYPTKKTNSDFHGIGLKSIQSVVKKYNGEFSIYQDDNSVVASVILCCE